MKYLHTIAILGALSLSACSSNTVKETLGLDRAAPDEYRVVSRPPLSVPPQFSLRPPSTSDASPNQLSADKQAQSLVTGKPGKLDDTAGLADTAVLPVTVTNSKRAAKEKPSSGADSLFLKNAGADKADPKVREVLVEEKYSQQEKQESGSWWDMFTLGSEKKDPLVDAKKESERIQKTEDEGQPVTTGDTPEVKGKDTGVLGRILGY